MAGIVFVRTSNLQPLVKFYTEKLGMKPWLSQPGVEMLSHGNMILGFHEQKDALDVDSLFTFFYQTKKEVDQMYETLKDIALSPPKTNEKYSIYQFFAKDPEGRLVEIQKFLHELPPLNTEF